MVTNLQKRAIERVAKNGGNVSRAMVEVGYSPNTAKTPQKLTQSKGYKELLEEYGLTEGLITRALVADIKSKEGDRVQELKLGAEILGMKQEVEPLKKVVNNYNFFNVDQLRKVAARTVNGDTTGEEQFDRLSDSNESEVRSELAS